MDVNWILPIVAITLFVVAAYYAMTIVFLFFSLPLVGYRQIRRLGYSPSKAATLVLSVAVVAVLATLATALFIPSPAGFLGGLGSTLLCIGISILFLASGCTLLIRTLPKRGVRVSGPRRARLPFVYLGYLVIAGAIAGAVAVLVFAPAENKTFSNSLGLLVAVSMTALGGKALIDTGKRVNNEVSIEDASRIDPRPPVLFLRPFAAERVPFVRGLNSKYGQYATANQQMLAAIGSTSDSAGNKRDEDPTISIMFEVYLGRTFRERIGPFIALGNPEDYLPPEGAIRTYADDEGWYEYFERLARCAVCMVMPLSDSDNLQRELTFLRREGLQQRLFIVTPLWYPTDVRIPFPARASAWIALRLYGLSGQPAPGANWRQLAGTLGKFGFDLGEDPGRGAALTFDSEGKAILLVTGAEAPRDFVEPIREYLVRTFGLDLGEAAAARV